MARSLAKPLPDIATVLEFVEDKHDRHFGKARIKSKYQLLEERNPGVYYNPFQLDAEDYAWIDIDYVGEFGRTLKAPGEIADNIRWPVPLEEEKCPKEVPSNEYSFIDSYPKFEAKRAAMKKAAKLLKVANDKLANFPKAQNYHSQQLQNSMNEATRIAELKEKEEKTKNISTKHSVEVESANAELEELQLKLRSTGLQKHVTVGLDGFPTLKPPYNMNPHEIEKVGAIRHHGSESVRAVFEDSEFPITETKNIPIQHMESVVYRTTRQYGYIFEQYVKLKEKKDQEMINRRRRVRQQLDGTLGTDYEHLQHLLHKSYLENEKQISRMNSIDPQHKISREKSLSRHSFAVDGYNSSSTSHIRAIPSFDGFQAFSNDSSVSVSPASTAPTSPTARSIVASRRRSFLAQRLPTLLDPLPDIIPEEDIIIHNASVDMSQLIQHPSDPTEDVSMPLSARSPLRKHHHNPFDFTRFDVQEIRDALLEDTTGHMTTQSMKITTSSTGANLIPNNLQRTLTRTPTNRFITPLEAGSISSDPTAPSTPKHTAISRRSTPVGFSYTENGHIKEVHYSSLQPKPRPSSAELRRKAGNISSAPSFDFSSDGGESMKFMSSINHREPSLSPERPASSMRPKGTPQESSPSKNTLPSSPTHALHKLHRMPTVEKLEVITKTHVPAGIPAPIVQRHGSMIMIDPVSGNSTLGANSAYQLIRPPAASTNDSHFHLLQTFYQEKQHYDAEIAQKRQADHTRKRNLLNVKKISEYQRTKERSTLMGIFDMCHGEGWHRADNWGSMEVPVSDWFGIATNVEGSVIEINLPHNNLKGDFPDILHDLKYLEVINLDHNELSSTIADYTLQQCSHMKIISACHNKLTGIIPFDFFCDLTSLQEIWLHNNNFSGNLQSGLCRLSNTITHISLDNNNLTGQLSPQISKLSNLKYLSLSCNQLSGEIPHSIIGLHRLEVLSLHSNQFTGRIPDFLDSIPSLYDIRLYNNRFSNPQTAVVDQLLSSDTGVKLINTAVPERSITKEDTTKKPEATVAVNYKKEK